MSVENYRRRVDTVMRREYGITTVDAGIDDEQLSRFMADSTPEDFVNWFGRKYDLDPVTRW